VLGAVEKINNPKYCLENVLFDRTQVLEFKSRQEMARMGRSASAL